MIGLCLFILLPNSVYTFNGIRSFISSQAVIVSFLDEVTHEFLDRPLAIKEITGLFNNHIDYFYIGCIASSITYITLNRIFVYPSFTKLNELPIYKNSYRNFRVFLFIIIMLFMRDIENAI
jgi:hypothetical protein